jgi:catechol 2,3-dioxygenase-like lactoylglutathione lyase family enzyme
MLRKLNHVVIFVSDIQIAVDFYTKTLELPLRSQSDHWSEVGGQENGVYIGLHETTKDRLITDSSKDTPDITFSVENIQKVQEELISKGVKFRRKANEIAPGEWVATFSDLDNNKLTIHQSIKAP